MNITTPLHPVVELRQYTLHAGRRAELIALFDRAFVETQEAAGIAVLGQFVDLDDPDRFVWLRGFTSLADRPRALAAFYDGPVWREHRDAANATMRDSDDVLLLRPTGGAAPMERWRRGEPHARGMLVAFVLAMADAARPAVASLGGEFVGEYVTEPAPNNFPRLPVREGESLRLWLARFGEAPSRAQLRALAGGAPLQILRLAPTARSRF